MSPMDAQAHTSLTQRTRLAVLWNTGITSLISIGQFGLMLVMVRLLDPGIYGQYGLLMAIIGFLHVFSAQNYVDYTLQVRREADVHYQDIFTTSVVVSAALFVVTNFIAVGMGALPEYAETSVPLHWLSLGFLLQPGRAVRIAMLKRALDWKRIRVLHGIGFVSSACLALPLAYTGAGIYALLVPTFVVPLPFLYDIFVRCAWRPSWAWSIERLKPAFGFGVNRQISGLIVAGRRLLESGVMVHMLGFASVGIYGRAIGLSEIVCNRLLAHGLEALHPALTKVEPDSARFRRVGGLVLRTSAWLAIPVAALMTLLASQVVRLVYGQKWLEVIPLLGWTMALAATGALYFTLYKLLLAHQQHRHCLWTDVLSIAGTALALLLLLPDGLVGYIQGLVAVQIGLVAVSAMLLVARRGLEIVAMVEALAPAALATTAAVLAFEGSALHAPALGAGAVSVGLQTLVYVLVYLAVLRLAFPGALRELVAVMPRSAILARLLLLESLPRERSPSRT